MRLMPVTDAMFLWGESREMPMHIGGINLYTLPDDVDETEWLNEQLALLRQSEGLRRPFSEVLKLTPLGQYGPIRLEPDRDIDMHYHRSEEHTSELQSLMRISYAVFCLKNKNTHIHTNMISTK